MSPEMISYFVITYTCLLFSLCFHEAAHAVTAERCGDPTARMLGRITLNPIAHIDPIGTIAMPLLMMVMNVGFFFGWAKPVPFNPRHLKNTRRDPVLIAVAGPISNLLLVALTICVARVAFMIFGFAALENSLFYRFAESMITMNLLLTLFNLIPVPPLDGSYVLGYFLPDSARSMLEQIGPFGILIAVFVSSRFLGTPLQDLHEGAMVLLQWGFQKA